MFWVELHCDARTSPRCLTNVGDSPGHMARNTWASMRVTRETLANEAIKNGWVKQGGKIVCPRCQAPTT